MRADTSVRIRGAFSTFGLPIAPRNTVQLTWCYRLDPSATGGTDATESFELEDIAAMQLYWRALGRVRGPRMKRDMQRTLQAIKAVVEAGK